MAKWLCLRCRHAMGMIGERHSEARAFCGATEPHHEMTFRVVKCSEFEERNTSGLYDMKQIAWVIRKDNHRFVGFMPPGKKEDE